MTMPATGDTSGGAPSTGSSGTTGGGTSTPSTTDSGDGGVTLRDRMAAGMGGGDDTDEAGKPRAKPKEPEKPAAPKYKVRRGDVEEEHDGETLARMQGDDWEHEFSGPGGRKFKLTRPDIAKNIALAQGAKARMERAVLDQRRVQQEREAGKKDPISYLESVIGLEDAERWALETAQKRMEADAELDRLSTSQDPRDRMRAEQMRQDRVRQQLQRRENIKRSLAEQEAKQQQAAQARERAGKELQDAFGKVGLPWSSHVRDIGQRILREYADGEIHLKPDELATEVRRTYLRERRAELDAMDAPAIFAFLGDGLRAKLRQFEIEAIKGAKKEQRAVEREEQRATPPAARGPIDEAELLRRRRGG